MGKDRNYFFLNGRFDGVYKFTDLNDQYILLNFTDGLVYQAEEEKEESNHSEVVMSSPKEMSQMQETVGSDHILKLPDGWLSIVPEGEKIRV